MLVRFTHCFIISILFITSSLNAQEATQDTITSKYSATLPTHFFIKNNEYFNPYTEGFTGIGVIVQPSASYHFDEKSKLTVGVHFLKYSGLNSFSEIIPLIRFESQLLELLTLIVGNIDGASKHKLSEPLYRYDLDYQNRVEYGLQVLISSERIKSDTWLHWDQFIEKNDPFPEELFVGNVTRFDLVKKQKVDFSINTELLISHVGGQIDKASNPDRTLLNYSISPSVSFGLQKLNLTFIPGFYNFSIVNGNQLNNGLLFLSEESGHGFWYQLKSDLKKLEWTIGFWDATNFYSPIGESLYFSYNDETRNLISSERSLVTSSLHFPWQPFEYLHLDVGYRGYYDTDTRQFDYTVYFNCLVSLYLLK